MERIKGGGGGGSYVRSGGNGERERMRRRKEGREGKELSARPVNVGGKGLIFHFHTKEKEQLRIRNAIGNATAAAESL